MKLENIIPISQKVICMAIDINKLQKGEKVICDSCNKGTLIPRFGAPPDKAPQFICTECGEKFTLNFGVKKTANR
jgi:transposase-like protein